MASQTTPKTAPSAAAKRLLDRHARLRDSFQEAFAAFETSEDAPNSSRGRKLAAKRDQAHDRLADVAEKLRALGFTLANADSLPEPSTDPMVEIEADENAKRPGRPASRGRGPAPKPEPEPEPVTLPETPAAYGDDRAAFLRDHVQSLGRSKRDKAEKALAKAELTKLDGDSKPKRSKLSDDGLTGSQRRKCECNQCGAILRMSPAAEQTAGGLPRCACSGQFVRSNVAA